MDKVENEIMLIAQEECAEVTQAISKVFRFGMDSEYNGNTNKQRLEEEIGDALCMFMMMSERGLIDWGLVSLHAGAKKLKLKQWSNIT